MKGKIKVPKCPVRGWRWATGLEPNPQDRFSGIFTGIVSLNEDDMAMGAYPAPVYDEPTGRWSGYIRRIPKPKTARKEKA